MSKACQFKMSHTEKNDEQWFTWCLNVDMWWHGDKVFAQITGINALIR